MTPPAKAGGFSGNGTGNRHRLRLKAPSGPCSQMQDVQRGVQITSQNHATTGAVVHPLAEGLWDMLAAARTALRRAGWVHLTNVRPASSAMVDRIEINWPHPASLTDFASIEPASS